MAVFSIGDRVIVRRPTNTIDHPSWTFAMDQFDGVVQEIETHSSNGAYRLKNNDYWFNEAWLTLVDGPSGPKLSEELTLKENNMSATELAHAKLSVPDRFAIKENWQTEGGRFTSDGSAVLIQYLYDLNRDAMIIALQAARKVEREAEKELAELEGKTE